MAFGTAMTKVDFDAQTDDPKLAFTELASNVDAFNTFRGLILAAGGLGVTGDGVKDDGAGNLTVGLASDAGMEYATKLLKIKLQTDSGLERVAGGLKVDINGLSTATFDPAADSLMFRDGSDAGKLKKNTGNNIFSSGGMQVFTSSGTFTQPTGITTVKVICIGGGGGSAPADGGGGPGGGGGGGECVEGVVTIGGNITVTIGAGGAAGSAANGSPGGDTTFGSLMTAKGGLGGEYSTGAAGGAGGTGGSVTGDELAILDGEAGEAPSSKGGDGGVSGRFNGRTTTANGGPGGNGASAPGTAGDEPGFGGGGGDTPSGAGAAGFRGICIVIY